MRLDRRIDAATYDKKATEIRRQQEQTRQKIRATEATMLTPANEAVNLMALTSRTAELFLAQSGAEQRRLLHLVLREASWKANELRMSFRTPFEELRLSNSACAQNFNELEGKESDFDNWRRKRDSNPRASHPANGFQDRRLQPLGHSSISILPDSPQAPKCPVETLSMPAEFCTNRVPSHSL